MGCIGGRREPLLRWLAQFAALPALCLPVIAAAAASPAAQSNHSDTDPQVVVGARTPINPQGSGYHGQTIAATDPASERNLILCGIRTDPKTGAGYEGYVYWSGDGGRSWREALIESGSQWVSETSCAYGLDHQAYFTALESDTTQGPPDHLMGTMRIFRSADGGRSWESHHTLDFLDYTSMVIDTSHSVWRNQLYLFANFARPAVGAVAADPTTIGGQPNFGDRPFLATLGELPDLRYRIASGKFSAGASYHGGFFPTGSAVLHDGRAVAVFVGRKTFPAEATGVARQASVFVAGTSSDGGQTLKPSAIHETKSPVSWPSLSVNPATDELLASWIEEHTQEPDLASSLMVAVSADAGQTWHVRPVTLPVNTSFTRGFGAAAAVNAQGVWGFLWYANEGTEALFGLSYDAGRSIGRVIPLTPAAAGQRTDSAVDDRKLFVYPADWSDAHGGPIQVLGRGYSPQGAPLGPPALVVDAVGAFHPIWTEKRNGPIHLWTRRIEVGKAVERVSGKAHRKGLRDVSNRLACHISNTRYDNLGDLVAFDLMVTNRSDATIPGPMFAVMKAGARALQVSADNSDNREAGEGALWELSVPAEGLRAGQSSDPRTLTFRIRMDEKSSPVEVPVRIYASGPGSGS